MNGNETIQLSDAASCSAAVTAFYDLYRVKIADIKTVEQRNDILSDIQQYFEREVRRDPQNRNKLSEIYQLLKRKCWEVRLW